MRTHTERKAALYGRTRRLLMARTQGRIIGRLFDDLMRRIRERAHDLEATRLDPDALTRGDRRSA